MKRSQKRAYLKLEKRLKDRYKNIRENELVLAPDDFKKGHLRNSGFVKLKEECWYIPYGERVIVNVPEDIAIDLKADFGFFAVRALSKIKNDRKSALFQSIMLFLVGIIILAFLTLLWDAVYEIIFLLELITILSWVFVWSGVGKWFIDQRDMQDKRFTILQLLSADIVSYHPED